MDYSDGGDNRSAFIKAVMSSEPQTSVVTGRFVSRVDVHDQGQGCLELRWSSWS